MTCVSSEVPFLTRSVRVAPSSAIGYWMFVTVIVFASLTVTLPTMVTSPSTNSTTVIPEMNPEPEIVVEGTVTPSAAPGTTSGATVVITGTGGALIVKTCAPLAPPPGTAVNTATSRGPITAPEA